MKLTTKEKANAYPKLIEVLQGIAAALDNGIINNDVLAAAKAARADAWAVLEDLGE